MSDLTLCGLCGSLRRSSYNRMLMMEAVRHFAPGRFVDGDLDLPLYNGDVEDAEGVPEAVTRLAQQVGEADAVLIVTPEYNQSLSGVLKNALDWISRTDGKPWLLKPVAIMSAADGRAGGARASYALRLCLATFRPNLIPGPEILVANASKEFDADGRLTSPRYGKALSDHMAMLRETALSGRVTAPAAQSR